MPNVIEKCSREGRDNHRDTPIGNDYGTR
jgi:hypothetical protein